MPDLDIPWEDSPKWQLTGWSGPTFPRSEPQIWNWNGTYFVSPIKRGNWDWWRRFMWIEEVPALAGLDERYPDEARVAIGGRCPGEGW